MILRADDFKDKGIFLCLAEEAQDKGLITAGSLSWDEGDSVVDLDTLELDVRPRAIG
jgi:hypothetical protein